MNAQDTEPNFPVLFVRANVILIFLVFILGFSYQVVTATSFNRQNAINYADTYAHTRNSNFPNYGDENSSECNDCTNYLSQILQAGGLPQIPGNDDVFHWYTYWGFDWSTFSWKWLGSKSWAATPEFNTHAFQYVRDRFYYPPTFDLSAYQGGDFMLLDLPTYTGPESPNHARIFVGWGYAQEGDTIGQWGFFSQSALYGPKTSKMGL
jgi:hypothetical protein